jgi:AraC-like DNA-binding protein
METIAWLGFSQGLFAAILMMTKKEQSVADKLLSAWLSLLAIEFLTCAIDYRIFGKPLLSSSFLLFNPAFYLYARSLITSTFRLKWLQLLHLIPFVFFETFAYVVQEPYTLGEFFEPDSTLWFRYFFGILSMISWISYNYATAVSIFRHRRMLVNEFSNIESNKRIGWLLFIVISYNFYCLLLMSVAVLSIFLDVNYPLPQAYNYSAMLIMVYILGFYGLKQQTIYKESALPENINERYSKSPLSAQKKSRIKSIIIDYFDKEKPYLNPELNMDMLSEILDIPKHQLTEVLNIDIGKNFFHFVNEYRIEAVKEQLLDPNNYYSIEAIGYDCGFSSKSSFFTVFKKISGQTPMQFRNSISK